MEESFRQMTGVHSTLAGYAGGNQKNPSYEDVCSGTSGHIEVVEVTYDPNIVRYEQLLDKFFAIHDPSADSRWDNMTKRQYQSVIVTYGEDQIGIAQLRLEQFKQAARPVSTIILSSSLFFPEEERHQHYMQKRKSFYEGRV